MLVAAVGQAGLVRGDWVKPRATVVDVGITPGSSATRLSEEQTAYIGVPYKPTTTRH